MASCSGNGSRGHHKFTLNVWESYVSDGLNNYSTVSWELVISPIALYWDWYWVNGVGYRVYIDGVEYTGTINSYDGVSTVAVASGSRNIGHNNDGTKSINFSFEVWDNASANYLPGYASANGSMNLTNIPRYANFTSFDVAKIDETSVKISLSADAPYDWAQYRINDGSWVDLPNGGVISGLTANTSYKFAAQIRKTENQLWTISNDVWQTTYDYPKPTSVNNFTIGEGATVYLDNPLGRSVTLDLISTNDSSTIGTYTGTNNGYINAEFKTTSAINSQYASIPNSNSGTYYARVTYGSIVKTSGYGTYTTNLADCSPQFSDFTYLDSNTDATAITGNNQVFIKGVSTIEVVISSANKMTTRKSATPQNYTISCDTLNAIANYSDNDVDVELGTINSSGINRLNVKAYDSRNNSALVYKDITVYDYAKPTVNMTLARLNNFEASTTLTVGGTFDKLTIDNVDKNILTDIEYRYRETGGTWGSWTSINFTISGNEYTCSNTVLSLDSSKSFEVEVRATDRLSNTVGTGTVDVGQAIFFISSNQKKCYINGQEILEYDVVDTW